MARDDSRRRRKAARRATTTRSGEKAFSALVDLEAHDEATPEQVAFLRAPENLERWRKELVEIRRRLKILAAQRTADLQAHHDQCLRLEGGKHRFLEYKNDYEEWRRAAAPFQKKVAERIRSVEELIRAAPAPAPGREPAPPRPERKPEPKKEPPVDVIAWAARLIPDEGEGAYWHATVRALRLVPGRDENPGSTTARRRRSQRARERVLEQLDGCRSERERRELLEREGLTVEIIQRWRKSLGGP